MSSVGCTLLHFLLQLVLHKDVFVVLVLSLTQSKQEVHGKNTWKIIIQLAIVRAKRQFQ